MLGDLGASIEIGALELYWGGLGFFFFEAIALGFQ